MKKISIILSLLVIVSNTNAQKNLPLLKVSPNGRMFQTADGKPFFWLGDTGWLLFVKTNRQEALDYLNTRQEQGYNVVQVMVLHDLNNTVNAFGDSALVKYDVSKPKTTPGNNPDDATEYDYWDHVDFIIDEAAKRGMYMALVPVWGSNVKGGKVNVAQGEAYAKFLAERYKNRSNIIWLNGGDVKGTDGMTVWHKIGETIKKIDSKHLMTFHPRGRTSSSDWFHNASWLDFNMFQSGHKNYSQDTTKGEKNHFGEDNWKFVNIDWAMKPTKPTMDGEPSYENIPQGLHDSMQPRWKPEDLRRYAYWSVLAGGAGFTYGENSVMQFNTKDRKTANYGVVSVWQVGLKAPGASQMQHIKTLILKLGNESRRPAQEIVVDKDLDKYNNIIATKGKGFAAVYTYTGRNFTIDFSKLGFVPKKTSWFNPAKGESESFELKKSSGKVEFDPPGEQANGNDWVLVLEN